MCVVVMISAFVNICFCVSVVFWLKDVGWQPFLYWRWIIEVGG